MVAIKDVLSANNDYYRDLPLVAVFVGGTQGIGRYAIEALAGLYSTQPDKALRVYIVGRNQSSATDVLQKCRETCPHGEFIFVQANNVALIQDVDEISARITQLESAKDAPRIDLLVQTQAQILFGPRNETSEGLDQMLSLVYHSRIRFILQLMPLLEGSKLPDGAHVISIDAAGMVGKLFRDDLSLRDPSHYGYINVKSHAAYMTTIMFERLASEHKHLAFVYMYPGAVFGPAHEDASLPWWFKALMSIAQPIVRLTFATPPEDSGQRTLFLGTQAFPSARSICDQGELAKETGGSTRSGSYLVGSRCDLLAKQSDAAPYANLKDEGFSEEVWTHTIDTFRDIEQAGKSPA